MREGLGKPHTPRTVMAGAECRYYMTCNVLCIIDILVSVVVCVCVCVCALWCSSKKFGRVEPKRTPVEHPHEVFACAVV